MKVLFFLLALLGNNLLHAQKCYVFAGSYNRASHKSGIYVYSFDTVSGKLVFVSALDNVLNPAYLDISPDGRYVCACAEALVPGGGLVVAYRFDVGKGRLAYINKQKSMGENPVYLSIHPEGRWLVNGNYTAGSISVYSLDSSGGILPARQVITFADSSVNKERQRSAHIHATVFSPDGRYMFAPDLGADKIRCYTFDALADKPLSSALHPHTVATPGSGPRHFTFHPTLKYCYCIEEMGGTVSVYSYKNDELTSLQVIPAHIDSIAEGYHSADIHISPDGHYLYVSDRGNENNIAIFSINQQSGTLSNVGYESTRGDHPRNFAIEPTGKYLLVANQISGDVVVFKRDTETGKLKYTGNKIKIAGVSCLKVRYYPD
jgi:6-phosphogluconolactonase (cycloisomerase 2 family)